MLTFSRHFARRFRHHAAVLAVAILSFGAADGASAAIDMQFSVFNDAPDPAVAGGLFTYDITVENSQEDPAPNAKLSLALDANVTFVPAGTSAICTYVAIGHKVECDFGTLNGTFGAGGGAPVSVQIVVTSNINGVVSANGTVSTTGVDANPGNDNQTVNTTIDRGADLFFQTFSAAPDPVVAAGMVTYTTIIRNLGPFAAADAQIIFSLPPGLAYVAESSAGWSCSAPGGGPAVTCNSSASIASGSNAATLTWTAKATSVGTLSVLGTVSSTTGDGNESNNTTTEDVVVDPGTDLRVTKTVSDDPVKGGTPVSFTINVDNLGPLAAATVQVTDTIPAGFTGISASGTGWSCGVLGSIVTCDRATLAVGSAPAITVLATAPANALIPAAGTTQTNTALVTTATNDPIGGNNSGSVTYSLQKDGADLRPTMSRSPSPVSINTNITSTIRVRNNGPRDATGQVGVQYTLLANETYISSSGTNWTCPPAPVVGVVTCSWSGAGPLVAGGSSTNPLRIITQVSVAGTSTSMVCTSTTAGFPPTESDINTGNDCTSRGVLVSNASADLRLTKSVVPASLADNASQITYTLLIENLGPDAADNVRLTDPIPMYAAAFNGRPATTVNGTFAGGTCTGTSTQICNVGTIAAFASKTVTITVDRPMRSGNWTNNASAFSQTIGDPARGNNRDSASVTIAPQTDIELTQKSVLPDPVKAGVEATYTIQLRNNGPSDAANVIVTDTFTIPPGAGTFTFISATGSNGATCTPFNAGTLSVACDFGTLGDTEVQSMTVKIRPDFMAAPPGLRQFANTAVATTTTLESNALNNSKSATLDIVADEIDLLIEQSDEDDPVPFDPTPAALADLTRNLIVYKIDVTNRGPSFATGVSFTDTYAQGSGRTMTFLCDLATADGNSNCTAAPAGICLGGGGVGSNVVCAIGDLAASASTTRYLIYKVDSEPAPTGDTFNKTSTVTANEAETLAANNIAVEPTTVRVQVDVEVPSKNAAPASVSLNEPFNWTIVVTNNGPGTAKVVALSDNMPSNMVLTAIPTTTAGSCTGPIGTRNVSCAIGDLASGATATITLPVRITAYPAGGTRTNTATVATDSLDTIPGNDSKTGTVNVTRSSIACEVYIDANDDGQRAGETGIGGVTVRLTGTDNFGNAVNKTSITNGSGQCSFTNLSPSNPVGYVITETHPAAYIDGKDFDSAAVIANSKATDVINGVVLAADQNLTGYQFGELEFASLAGRVWYDPSNDGVIDGGEIVRIGGVQIDLTGTDDLGAPVTKSTPTDGSGRYSFTLLRPGTYTVTETQPGAYLPGLAAVGTGATGAAGTPDNALLAPTFGNVISGIGLASGNAGIEYNFGELRPGSLAGTVYYDIDNSAAQNAGEPGVGGATVTLTGTDYRGRTITPLPALTNATTGTYSFTSLLPGTYVITETQPPVYSDGQEALGSLGGTLGADVFTAINLASEAAGTQYDFGERSAGISGIVYEDLDNDGIRDGGEAGIPNVTITLTGCANRTTQTAANGSYQISGLPACPTGYTLSETQPLGFSDGKDTAGSHGGDAAVVNDVISNIVLGGTQYGTNYNFGEHSIGASDVACSTTSPSLAPAGPKNIREPFNWTFSVSNNGPNGAPVTNFANTLPAGLELTATPTATQGSCTGAAGGTAIACQLGYLTNGQNVTVTVPVRALSFPTGGKFTNGGSVNTIANDGVAGNDACQADVTIQQSTLAGKVFEDPNDNGTQDGGEANIPNVDMTLTGTDLYGNNVSKTAQTIANGSYIFNGLAPSDGTGYTIFEAQPAGFADGKDTVGDQGGTLANDVISAIPLGAAVNGTGYDFAEISQGLAGTVYVDSNNNGAKDPGEPGIPNVTITVTGTANDNSPVNLSVQTIADGTYFFGGLPPSNATGYHLSETQPAAWADGKDAVGSAAGTLANDQITQLVLPAGQISTDYDFGERGASVCGYVYSDLSNDGVRDGNEIGIPAAQLTLSGNDVDGRPILVATTTTDLTVTAGELGRYCFNDLPLPNGAGYTINETQPPDTTDGIDTVGTLGGTPGNDVISGITFTTPGIIGDDYNFGETLSSPAALSGFVWLDSDHERDRDEITNGRGGWTVELFRGPIGGTHVILGSTTTAGDGSYSFPGLPPGPGYGVKFRSPQGNYVYGYIDGITLIANTVVVEQNQPIDPQGVVYDALSRLPVPGAVVTFNGPPGFDPDVHLLGGLPNASQTTGPTGEYRFLLLPTAPSGTYTLDVTNPTGYIPGLSTAIPVCTQTLTVGAVPDPALVQTSDFAPVSAATIHDPATCPTTSAGLGPGTGSTQYYTAFILSTAPPTSANILNNHLPIEAVPTGGDLSVSKTTPKTEVSRGELVPYTITVRNNVDLLHTATAIVDQIPPGFKYRTGSASIDGIRTEPTVNGRTLTWSGLAIGRLQTRTVTLMLVVGSGVGEAEYINQAWVRNTITGGIISNIATARVRVVPDPTFDCSDIIGKVFDDTNRNGYQNPGERGIANVRLVTVRGLLIKTDRHGRFHVACADIPDEDRGSNFIIKLDTRTLPTGYRITTENPRVVRLTRGKMTKLNFGAAIHRVVRIDVAERAFEQNGTALRPRWARAMSKALETLAREKSVLRIAYRRSYLEPRGLAKQRISALVRHIRRNWRHAGGRYDLPIETEFYAGRRLK